MKATLKILSPLLLFVAISCSKDDEIKPTTSESYVKIDVAGTRANGNYLIEKQDNDGEVVDLCQYFPGDPQAGLDGKVALSYIDNKQNIGFSLVVPTKEKLTEIIEENPYEYEIKFSFEFGVLEASTVSVHVTKLKLTEDDIVPLVTYIKGNFEGVVVHTNYDEVDDNGDPIKESHTVKGDFEYNIQLP